MRVLLLGGTGLISVGIVKHLLAREADVTVLNRGLREDPLPRQVNRRIGDRDDPETLRRASAGGYDAVIDMICFTPAQATAAVDAFGGRCGQFVFCSTVCTYGVNVPTGVVIDETFPQEPISEYGRNKLACERLFLEADAAGKFRTTVIRPSSTYGPGGRLIDNLEFDPVSWGRIERGEPVLCAGDGLGLWNSTHRDDCGKLFAGCLGNPTTFGRSYNATRQEVFTWRDLYRQTAEALGRPARLLFMPAGWIVARDPKRFGLLREITQFHGAYTSAKAMADVPEFRCGIDYRAGAAETLADAKRRGTFKTGDGDALYGRMVADALAAGVEPVEA